MTTQATSSARQIGGTDINWRVPAVFHSFVGLIKPVLWSRLVSLTVGVQAKVFVGIGLNAPALSFAISGGARRSLLTTVPSVLGVRALGHFSCKSTQEESIPYDVGVGYLGGAITDGALGSSVKMFWVKRLCVRVYARTWRARALHRREASLGSVRVRGATCYL